MQRKKKIVKTVTIIVAAILLVAIMGVGALFAYTVLPYRENYQKAERVFEIPGFADGFVAQGLAYDSDSDTFLVCGYDLRDGPSALYCIRGDRLKKVLLKNERGDIFSGHCGGVAVHGDYIYVAGSGKGCVYVLRYGDVREAEDGGYVGFCARVDVGAGVSDGLRVSFAGGDRDRLLVGEYYRTVSYETPNSHRYEYAGERFGALMLEYAFDDDSEWGISPLPTAVYSIPDDVQGATFDDKGCIYFSASGGYSASHILAFDVAKMPRAEDITVGEARAPHYLTVAASQCAEYKNPPMSEEIVIVEGKLYVMNEYSSSKFVVGRFSGARYCYAIDLKEIVDR